jgi:hypothetical protein
LTPVILNAMKTTPARLQPPGVRPDT